MIDHLVFERAQAIRLPDRRAPKLTPTTGCSLLKDGDVSSALEGMQPR